jgi:hypothetical protein
VNQRLATFRTNCTAMLNLPKLLYRFGAPFRPRRGQAAGVKGVLLVPKLVSEELCDLLLVLPELLHGPGREADKATTLVLALLRYIHVMSKPNHKCEIDAASWCAKTASRWRAFLRIWGTIVKHPDAKRIDEIAQPGACRRRQTVWSRATGARQLRRRRALLTWPTSIGFDRCRQSWATNRRL